MCSEEECYKTGGITSVTKLTICYQPIFYCQGLIVTPTFPLEDERIDLSLYITFNTCSLICSSSSFIITTIFCISAWLLFEPVVLISRPIS